MGEERSAAVDGSEEVGFDGSCPADVAAASKGPDGTDHPGVVDPQVNRPQLVMGPRREPLDLDGNADVDCLYVTGATAPGATCNRKAARGELMHQRLAQSPARSCHYGYRHDDILAGWPAPHLSRPPNATCQPPRTRPYRRFARSSSDNFGGMSDE